MMNIVREDLASYYSYPAIPEKNRRATFIEFLRAMLDVDFRIVFMYRISCWLLNSGFKKLGLLLYFRLKSAHSVDISPYAKIGPGLKLVHSFNIAIGPNVNIADHLVCFNSVNIGNSRTGWGASPESLNMPTIGSRVILCPGARIFGKIYITDDIIIGANQVVSVSLRGIEDLKKAKESGLKVYDNNLQDDD
jgi:serine acetyltransferase